MPEENLHEEDFHAWALDQGWRLRAAGKCPAPEHDGLDFERVGIEVEDLAHALRHKVECSLEVALRHLIKLAAAPHSDRTTHWKKEIIKLLDAAVDGHTASMRPHLNLEKIWGIAIKRTVRDLNIDGARLPDLPNSNPFHLEQLLDEDFDVDALVLVLMSAMPADKPDLT